MPQPSITRPLYTHDNLPEQPSSLMYLNGYLDELSLTPYEFRILAHVVRRNGGKLEGRFFASLSKTARICRMSTRKVQYSLKLLCEVGILTQESRVGRTSEYRVKSSRR
jgi:hypothetical protein